MTRTFVAGLIEKIGKDMGLEVYIEPWGHVGVVVGTDGQKRYFRGTSFDLNTLGASKIAKDKDYAAHFLKQFGYPVPGGEAFFSDEWAAAIGSDRTKGAAAHYAASLGYPVIVKPNSKSQGKGVMKAYTESELFAAADEIAQYDDVFLVQQPALGRDYRIVVLDGEVISAYERRPLRVVGDGVATIEHLLAAKQRGFVEVERRTHVPVADPRVAQTLARVGYTLSSTLARAEELELLPNANLSSGGEAIDVTDLLHEKWHTLAAQIARDMNLRYTGIDIMTKIPLSDAPGEYTVIEVNSAPGLDNYATLGATQMQRVEHMYRKIIEAMLR